jgi:hypothetical protein
MTVNLNIEKRVLDKKHAYSDSNGIQMNHLMKMNTILHPVKLLDSPY